MSDMQVVCLGELDYDGSQLRHALAYELKSVLGPTISYFIGSADVKEHLVDLEDLLSDDFIKSDRMLHFVIEIPGAGIQEAVVWQRLFMRIIASKIDDVVGKPLVQIKGDDLMVYRRKLSVSIATLSRFSALIHVGLNLHAGEGCPVETFSLEDVPTHEGISDFTWAEGFAQMFAKEFNDIVRATYKVIEVS